MNVIQDNQYWGIYSTDINTLDRLKKRLYSEEKMTGNEMRDWANILDYLIYYKLEGPITEGEKQ